MGNDGGERRKRSHQASAYILSFRQIPSRIRELQRNDLVMSSSPPPSGANASGSQFTVPLPPNAASARGGASQNAASATPSSAAVTQSRKRKAQEIESTSEQQQQESATGTTRVPPSSAPSTPAAAGSKAQSASVVGETPALDAIDRLRAVERLRKVCSHYVCRPEIGGYTISSIESQIEEILNSSNSSKSAAAKDGASSSASSSSSSPTARHPNDELEYPANPAKTYPFQLDEFQRRSIMVLEKGENVLVAAHTSAGKTVIAEYAVASALRDKSRVIYTAPIKALSNQVRAARDAVRACTQDGRVFRRACVCARACVCVAVVVVLLHQ